MNEQMQTIARLNAEGERYIQVAQVSFHTEDKLYQVRGMVKGLNASYDPTDQLVSIVTNKTLEAPAGTFSISLVGDKWFMQDGKKRIKANDLVVIQMGYKAKKSAVLWVDGTSHTSEEDMDTIMIGLVDTVTLSRNSGGNGMVPSISTTIQGRDFGKLLIKATLRFYPELGWSGDSGQQFFLTQQGWITLLKAFTSDNAIKGSPAKILDVIMTKILKPLMDISWKVYDDNIFQGDGGVRTVNIDSVLRYVFAETNFFIPFFMSAQQYEGSLWNMMSRVNLKPFTELFVDTRDRWEIANSEDIPQLVNERVEERRQGNAVMFGKKDGAQPVVVYRNTPFDKDSWNKLRSHVIAKADVIQDTLSYSDNEHYNLFWAGTTLTPFSFLDLKRVQPPLINETNVSRYGLNPLEIQVEGLELKVEEGYEQAIALEGLTNSLNSKLKAWYENMLEYLSGSIELRGKGSIKVGQRLIYSELDREFYIEGVTQNFQVYGDWHTVLNVTRGTSSLPNSNDYLKSTVAAAEDVAEPTPTDTSNYYTVQAGDTLWSIATAFYNNGTQWSSIWEANKDMLIARDSRNIDDPGHWIYPSQILRIP